MLKKISFLVCFLFLGCTATVEQDDAVQEDDAGIDVEEDIKMPPYSNYVPSELDPCGIDSYKNGVPIPIECQKGLEKFLKIQEIIDPPPGPAKIRYIKR